MASKDKEETKSQEQKATPSPSGSGSASKSKSKTSNNQKLIVEQVRIELETYFSPQNIQNDFQLRTKMTTDGYIDINLLLDLKLISDLAKNNRDILIEAIKSSKLLVMNTGCTMVKYMPLLERNTLILRDVEIDVDKAKILKIFDNEHCSKPGEVHRDIGNNWFCQFETEEQCLKTAKWLQQHGQIGNERLHVRVKAIHDVKKADTSPQMQQPVVPPKKSKSGFSGSQYPGYYGGTAPPQYAFYGAPMGDPYNTYGAGQYGAGIQPPAGSQSKSSRKSGKRSKKGTEDVAVEDAAKRNGAQQSAAAGPGDEDRTATSDYPGKFDKYTMEEFIAIYKSMNDKKLHIPQLMRGRDLRIVSEETQVPIALQPPSSDIDDDEHDNKEMQTKSKKSKRRKNRKKEEYQGVYYAEDGYYEDNGNYYEYDEYGMYDENAYYYQEDANEYVDDYYYDQDQTQFTEQLPAAPQQEEEHGNGGRSRRSKQRYSYEYDEYDEQDEYYRNKRKQVARAQARARNAANNKREYKSKRSGGNNKNKVPPKPKGKGGRAPAKYSYLPKNRAKPEAQAQPQPAPKKQASQSQSRSSGRVRSRWTAKPAKQYTTNRGVYTRKTASAF